MLLGFLDRLLLWMIRQPGRVGWSAIYGDNDCEFEPHDVVLDNSFAVFAGYGRNALCQQYLLLQNRCEYDVLRNGNQLQGSYDFRIKILIYDEKNFLL